MTSTLRVSVLALFVPIFFAVLLLIEDQVDARDFRPDQMPNGDVFLCSNCHFSRFGGGPRNGFGEAVRPLVTVGGRELYWGPALAAEDSDGDGVPNGVELQDPDGLWQPGMDQPGDPMLVSNPGDPESVPPEPPDPVLFHRGDPNASNDVDLTDAVFLFNFLFLGREAPTCLEAANVNDDAGVDLSDGIALLNFLFLGNVPPPAPGPTSEPCGEDPEDSESDLGCESYPPCEP